MKKFHPDFRERKPGLYRSKYLPKITLRLIGGADSNLDLPDVKLMLLIAILGCPLKLTF